MESKRGSNARDIGPMSIAVSAELRAELARQGYNVQRFAAASHLPLSTLHKTLKAQRVVDVEDLFAICDTLGIDPGPLIDAAAAKARAELDDGLLADERYNIPPEELQDEEEHEAESTAEIIHAAFRGELDIPEDASYAAHAKDHLEDGVDPDLR